MSVDNIPDLILDENTGNSLLLIGSSKSGKSHALMGLYDKYYSKPKYISTLFALNPQIEVYKGHKRLIVCDRFGAHEAKYIRAQKYVNVKTKNKYNFVVMIDDFIAIRYSKILNDLILTLRNSNISSMICLQFTKLLSKEARSNVNGILFFSLNSDEAIIDTVAIYLKGHFRTLTSRGFPAAIDPVGFYRDLTQNHNTIYLHVASGHLWSSLYGVLLA